MSYVMAYSESTTPTPVALTVVTSSLPNGTAGTAYTETTLSATGGTAPYTWSEIELLPPGLTLSSAGVISGTPTTAGTYSVRVQVRDSAQATADSGTMPVVIASANTLRITTTFLANGRVNSAYSATLAATGGTSPYTFAVSAGSLPSGLSLAGSTGVISGTPTAAGTSSVTFQVTDSVAATATSGSYQLVIDPALPLEIVTSSPLNRGEVGEAYSRALVAAGGVTPYTWAVTTGSLPTGLSLAASTGIISGTPSAEGTSTFTVSATDSTSPTARVVFKELALTIDEAGAIEGPHDYFNELVASPYHYRSYSLRSQAQVTSLRFRTDTTPRQTNYIWPDDPFPDAQDAAKIVIGANVTNYEVMRLNLGFGAEPLGVTSGSTSLFLAWDFYWDQSYVDGHTYPGANPEIYRGTKSFNLRRGGGGNAAIWFEPRNRFIGFSGGLAPGQCSYWDIRGYTHDVTAPDGLGQGTNFPVSSGGSGMNYGSDALGIMDNEYIVPCNKWVRMFFTITFTAGSARATNINYWMADEDQDPVQIISNLQEFWPARSDNLSPGGTVNHLEVEFNYSQSRLGPEWIAYVRNAVALRDVPDYTVYLQRPVR